jgi:hypothetical protein
MARGALIALVVTMAVALAGCGKPQADRRGFCAEGNQLQDVVGRMQQGMIAAGEAEATLDKIQNDLELDSSAFERSGETQASQAASALAVAVGHLRIAVDAQDGAGVNSAGVEAGAATKGLPKGFCQGS